VAGGAEGAHLGAANLVSNLVSERAKVVAEGDFHDRAACRCAREDRIGHSRSVDRVLRVEDELSK